MAPARVMVLDAPVAFAWGGGMTEPASRVMSAAVAYVRRFPAGRWLTWERLFRVLRRAGLPPWAECPVGPYRLVLDMGDFFQAKMALGHYEPDFELLVGRVLRAGDTYVDVGAQLGFTAALAARQTGPTGRMVLFEPDRRAFVRLQAHIATGSAAAPQVSLVEAACSDIQGAGVLREAPIIGWSQIRVLREEKEEGRGGQDVRLVRLDDALEEAGVGQVRLLKMDVEGHELFALRGLQGTLGAGRIDYVYIEKNPGPLRRNGASAAHLHALLAKHGYRAAQEDGTRVTREAIERERLENLLYARTEELLRQAAPAVATDAGGPAYTEAEVETAWREAMDPDSPVLQAHALIYRAASGHLADAIEAGEALLAAHPEMLWFEGHVAHWYVSAGDWKGALVHYEALRAKVPDNEEVAGLVVKCREALERWEGLRPG